MNWLLLPVPVALAFYFVPATLPRSARQRRLSYGIPAGNAAAETLA